MKTDVVLKYSLILSGVLFALGLFSIIFVLAYDIDQCSNNDIKIAGQGKIVSVEAISNSKILIATDSQIIVLDRCKDKIIKKIKLEPGGES